MTRRGLLSDVAIVLTALGVAAYWTHRSPPEYEATAILDLPPPESGGRNDDIVARRLAVDEWLETQLYLLGARTVAERAQRSLLALHPPVRASVEALQAGAQAARVPQTTLVRVTFTDHDAVRAAEIANALSRALLIRSTESRQHDLQLARSALDEQIVALTNRLRASEAELAAKAGPSQPPLSLEDSQKLVSAQITTLSTTLLSLHVHRIELSARYTKLSTLLKDNPALAYSSELEGNETLARLRSEHSLAVVRLRSYDATGAGDSRAEAQVRASLQVLEGQIRTVTDGILRGARAELEETQQVEKETQAEFTKANATARALQMAAAERGPFERERASSEQMLRSLRERAAALVSQAPTASRGRLTEPAVPPTQPRPKQAGVNLAIALALGLSVVALKELAGHRRTRRRSPLLPPLDTGLRSSK